MESFIPGTRGEDQGQGHASQARVAGGDNELATHALSEAAVYAGVLAILTRRVGVKRLELPVQRLSGLAVLESKPGPTM